MYLCVKKRDMDTEIYKSIAALIFPKELLDYFDVTGVETIDIPEKDRKGLETGEVVFSLDEKNELRGKEEGHAYRPNGFYEESEVRDFPLRDKKVTLRIRRRKWVDETSGKSVSNSYDLTADGTRHSVEFAAFLKECFGSIPDISLFS